VAKLAGNMESGDNDPLDICVLSERPILRGDLLLRARVVGGIPTVDSQQSDDKILAVLVGDAIWGDAKDIAQLPQALIERLCHYFGTYKTVAGEPSRVTVGKPYSAAHAHQVIRASIADYQDQFPVQA
jgi:inorganic pyrophosphatase